MKRIRHATLTVGLALLVLFAIARAMTTRNAMAVGSVTELPFIGSYTVSCGYHTSCVGTPTAGYGLDFINANGATNGRVAYASGDGTVVENNGDPNTGWGYRVVLRHPDLYYSR